MESSLLLMKNWDKENTRKLTIVIAWGAVYMAFAWSDGPRVHPMIKEKARAHDVAFFDITSGQVLYPDGFVLDLNKTEKISFWQRMKSFLTS